MPSIYQFLPNAVSQGQAQRVYAEVTTPGPQSFNDPMWVVIPDWDSTIPFLISGWPALHGNTLPLPGNAAFVEYDTRGFRRCIWWDGLMTFSTQNSLSYYLTTTNSDVANYKQQATAAYSPRTALPLITSSGVLENWVTQPNSPSLRFLPAGQYECHIHAQQTAGNATVLLYGQFFECNAGGVDIALIGETQTSIALGESILEYRLFFFNPHVYNLASSTSRIVCRLSAIVGGTGTAGLSLFVGGTADSHIILPGSITGLSPATLGFARGVDTTAANGGSVVPKTISHSLNTTPAGVQLTLQSGAQGTSGLFVYHTASTASDFSIAYVPSASFAGSYTCNWLAYL